MQKVMLRASCSSCAVRAVKAARSLIRVAICPACVVKRLELIAFCRVMVLCRLENAESDGETSVIACPVVTAVPSDRTPVIFPRFALPV